MNRSPKDLGGKSVSVPTRLFAEAEEPARQVSPQGSVSARHWSSLRQAHCSQELADRARSYILTMLHQDNGPRLPGQ